MEISSFEYTNMKLTDFCSISIVNRICFLVNTLDQVMKSVAFLIAIDNTIQSLIRKTSYDVRRTKKSN